MAKFRPQFQLRFYDETQKNDSDSAADEAGLSTNEWICRIVSAELERWAKSKAKAR